MIDGAARKSMKVRRMLKDRDGLALVGLYYLFIDALVECGGTMPLTELSNIAIELGAPSDWLENIVFGYGMLPYDDEVVMLPNATKKAAFTPDLSFADEAVREDFRRWLDYKRKDKREGYKSQKSVELCYKRLMELASGSAATASRIIEQSIACGWKGLFALKENNAAERADKKNVKLNVNDFWDKQ